MRDKIISNIKALFLNIKRFAKKSNEDSLSAHAAQTTFFILLSFFPFIFLLMLLINKLPFVRANVIAYLLDIVPGDLKEYVFYVMDDIYYSDSYSFTIFTGIVCLWSAAKGIQSLTKGLDKIYKVEEKKNFFLSRLISAIYTMLFMFMCLFIMIIQTFGARIVKKIIESYPLIKNQTLFVYSMKNAFTFLVVYIMLLIMYYQLPNRKGKLRNEMLGAFLGAVAFLVLTNGFAVYVNRIISKSYMYGSMTSVIAFMIWIYVVSLIVLTGAQINYFINNRS